jgi:hypothetical protein
MVQHILQTVLEKFEVIYTYSVTNPEVMAFVGILGFLLIRGKVKSALILIFGVALCFANYYMFLEYNYLTIPLIYAAGFAAISVVLLLLLVYQFIHTT